MIFIKSNKVADKNNRRMLLSVYKLLYKRYGPQKWWPADTPFEVMVGAILTQNTNWSNVEKAISNLKKQGALTPKALYNIDTAALAKYIRPCGYYNVKAKRLKSFLRYLFNRYSGRLSLAKAQKLLSIRAELLGVNGIGPETADSIILYALGKPIFVIDAYTRRIFTCMGIVKQSSSYDDIQSVFMKSLPESVKLFNEYHALIVRHAKDVCRAKPNCAGCVLRGLAGRQQRLHKDKNEKIWTISVNTITS